LSLTQVFFDTNWWDFFDPKGKKLKKSDFGGYFPDPEVADLIRFVILISEGCRKIKSTVSECVWGFLMGPGQNFWPESGWVNFFVAWVGSGRVSHLWFGFELQKFPLKMSNFSIFLLWVKNNCFRSGQKVPGSKPGQPLIYCRSKVSSGRVGSGPISSGNMVKEFETKSRDLCRFCQDMQSWWYTGALN